MPGVSLLRFRKLTPNASAPFKGSEKAAGFDLCSAAATEVPARGTALVPTDLQIILPAGCYGRIAPRSGLAVKGIGVGGGVIDEDYRGNVKVVLYNHSDSSFTISMGDRIAQLICEKICYPQLSEIGSMKDVDQTERGSNGFGSTGV